MKISPRIIRGRAGLFFELEGDKGVLAKSGKETMCRLSPDYVQHFRKKITMQLCFSYRYDAEKADNWKLAGNRPQGFEPADVKDLPKEFYPRPIRRLCLAPAVNGQIVQQGNFSEGKEGTAGERMLRAALSFVPPEEMFGGHAAIRTFSKPVRMTSQKTGMYIIVDLGREEAGYLYLDFTVPKACEVEIAYGEHLVDGRVRSYIDGRNFSFEYHAKAGDNLFCDPFRRLGGRYLQVFFHTDSVILRSVTVCLYFIRWNGVTKRSETVFIAIYTTWLCARLSCAYTIILKILPGGNRVFMRWTAAIRCCSGIPLFETMNMCVRGFVSLRKRAGRTDC